MRLVVTSQLREHLESADLPGSGLVFDASGPAPDWVGAREILMSAFAASQEAAVAESSMVYIVHGEDLLGRRGAPAAMVATGLLSAARTAAIELSRKGAVVNVVAVGDATPPETVARWVAHLCDPIGPSGEVVRLDAAHLGKALP
jgi:threonine dehydrogenase-like Zn-dependent dehydrogenase